MRMDLKDHQQQRQSEHGGFAPRAAATKARAGHNGRARRELGRLATAMTSKVTRQSLVMTSRVPGRLAARDEHLGGLRDPRLVIAAVWVNIYEWSCGVCRGGF